MLMDGFADLRLVRDRHSSAGESRAQSFSGSAAVLATPRIVVDLQAGRVVLSRWPKVAYLCKKNPMIRT